VIVLIFIDFASRNATVHRQLIGSPFFNKG
jgi:hypothetical protein